MLSKKLPRKSWRYGGDEVDLSWLLLSVTLADFLPVAGFQTRPAFSASSLKAESVGAFLQQAQLRVGPASGSSSDRALGSRQQHTTQPPTSHNWGVLSFHRWRQSRLALKVCIFYCTDSEMYVPWIWSGLILLTIMAEQSCPELSQACLTLPVSIAMRWGGSRV